MALYNPPTLYNGLPNTLINCNDYELPNNLTTNFNAKTADNRYVKLNSLTQTIYGNTTFSSTFTVPSPINLLSSLPTSSNQIGYTTSYSGSVSSLTNGANQTYKTITNVLSGIYYVNVSIVFSCSTASITINNQSIGVSNNGNIQFTYSPDNNNNNSTQTVPSNTNHYISHFSNYPITTTSSVFFNGNISYTCSGTVSGTYYVGLTRIA